MNKIQKKRLCWNCEGSVSLAEEICPFCGVSIIPASLDGYNQHFSPPYKLIAGNEKGVPVAPYLNENQQTDESPDVNSEDNDHGKSVDGFKRSVLATLFLLSGSVFFLFGLVLVLFSHNGIFTLQWNGALWFIYSGLSLPLLFAGWRMMIKLDDE